MYYETNYRLYRYGDVYLTSMDGAVLIEEAKRSGGTVKRINSDDTETQIWPPLEVTA